MNPDQAALLKTLLDTPAFRLYLALIKERRSDVLKDLLGCPVKDPQHGSLLLFQKGQLVGLDYTEWLLEQASRVIATAEKTKLNALKRMGNSVYATARKVWNGSDNS